MNAVKMIAVAGLLGAAYQFFTVVLGGRIATLVWRDNTESDSERRILLALAFGLFAQVAVTAVVQFIIPSAVKFVFWVCVFAALVDHRSTAQFVSVNRRALALAVGYGLVCYLILVSFHLGIAHGPNLLWTIYRLTTVTPGDSPQALLQAQYLVHGHQLINFEGFSLFDRPFLGGIVSLEELSAALLPPGTLFNRFPENQTFTYIALWIWLNAGFIYAVMALVRKTTARRHALICVLVMGSPVIVLNTIGAWPKLLAAYFACCAALLIIEKRWALGVLLGGVSFYTHGSFLWSHLATSGVLILYVLLSPHDIPHRYKKAIGLSGIALAFPTLWFGAEHLAHAATPLTTYYLYAVTPIYGLTHSNADIASAYYTSTTPNNLALVPFVNLVKAVLPVETLQWILTFSMFGPNSTLRSFVDALFMTQVNRSWFGFCLIGGAVSAYGLRRDISRNWQISLALVVFFALPMIPGLGIYRRDDHFIEAVMLFSVLPLIMAFGNGLNALSKNSVFAVTTGMISEYALIYMYRYPALRYTTFHEYYIVLVAMLLIATYTTALRLIIRDEA